MDFGQMLERSYACREELQSVLEGWIILGLRLGHTLPVVDGVDLTPDLSYVGFFVS